MAGTKTNTNNVTKTHTTQWHNKHLEKTIVLCFSEHWIFIVLLAICTCSVWRNMLSCICRTIGCHFKRSVNTLMTGMLMCYWHLLCLQLSFPNKLEEFTGCHDRLTSGPYFSYFSLLFDPEPYFSLLFKKPALLIIPTFWGVMLLTSIKNT